MKRFSKILFAGLLAIASVVSVNAQVDATFTYSHQVTQSYKGRIYDATLNYKITSEEEGNLTCEVADNSNRTDLIDVWIPTYVEHNSKQYKVTSIENNAFEGCSRLVQPIMVTAFINEFEVPVGTVLTPDTTDYEITDVVYTIVEGCRVTNYDGKHSCSVIEMENKGHENIFAPRILANKKTKDGIEYNVLYEINGFEDFAFRDCVNLINLYVPDNQNRGDGFHYGLNPIIGCVKLAKDRIHVPGATDAQGKQIDGICYQGKIIGFTQGVSSSGTSSTSAPSSIGVNTFPGATSIGAYAFYNCDNITIATIGTTKNPITSIGEYAFYGCDNITSVNLGASATITEIPAHAFDGCKSLSKFAGGSNIGSKIAISDNITCIGDSAFVGCKAITEVDITKNITSIGDNAFADCASLKTLSFRGLATKDDYQDPNTGNTEGGENTEGGGNTEGGENTGSDTTGSEPTEPENINVELGKGIFKGCSSLSTVNWLTKNIHTIGDNFFEGCSSLIEYPFNKYVTKLGNGVFKDCIGFNNKITILSTVSEIGNGIFEGCINLNIVELIARLPEIHSGIFKGNTYITQVILSSGTQRIGDSAFEGCTNLTGLMVPNRVDYIGDNAFKGCTALKTITLPGSLKTIGDSAFEGCVLIEAVGFSSNFETLGARAFKGCIGIDNINLPDHATSIGEYAFEDCTKLRSVRLGNGVTVVPEGAFKGCSSLYDIDLGDVITSVGEEAFKGCTELHTLKGGNVSADREMIIINNEVVYAVPEEDLDIPEGVTSIGKHACVDNTNLTEINFPTTLTNIGEEAFMGCTALKTIELPQGLTTIGKGAFQNAGLTSLIVPNKVETIGANAFNGDNLADIVLGANVTSIGEDAFLANSAPTVTAYCDAVPQLGEHSFENVATLKVPIDMIDGYTAAEYWKEMDIEGFERVEYLVDGVEYTNQVEKLNFTINYTRTFADKNWQSLYLPYQMKFEDWDAQNVEVARINNVFQYFNEDDGTLESTIIEFVRIGRGTTLDAHTPYLIRAKAASNKPVTITTKNVTLNIAPKTDRFVDCMSTKNIYTLYGTYKEKNDMCTDGPCYAMKDGALKRSTTDANTLPPCRIYLKIKDRTTGEPLIFNMPTRVKMSVDGEDIELPELSEESEDDVMYNLLGLPVDPDYEGIVIKSGKKYLNR